MATQNLTTYTEVDPNNHLSETATRVTASTLNRDETAYLYKDFGVDYFNALDIDFEIIVGAASSTAGGFGGLCVSNTLDSIDGFSAYDISALAHESASAPNHRIYLYRGAVAAGEAYGINPDTLYYLTLERVSGSSSVQLRIYSDSGRTTLLNTLNIAGFDTATKYRYLMPMNGYNDGGGGSFDGYVQNVDTNISGTAYTLPITAGIFNLSLSAVNLLRPIRNMAITAGQFTLSLSEVAYQRGKTMAISALNLLLTLGNVLFTRSGWNNETKHSATMTNQSKTSATPTNISKNSSSWTNQNKS